MVNRLENTSSLIKLKCTLALHKGEKDEDSKTKKKREKGRMLFHMNVDKKWTHGSENQPARVQR